MTLTIVPLPGIGEVGQGEDLTELLLAAVGRAGYELADGDALVVTHKIISKAEGRVFDIADDDDAAYRRLVLVEAVSILRRRGDLVITETEHGFVCANAGVDR